MKKLLTTLLAGAGMTAMAMPANAQLANPYDLSQYDITMEACTVEMGLMAEMQATLSPADPGEALAAYSSGRRALVASPRVQAFLDALRQRRNQRQRQLVYLEFNDADPTFNVFVNGAPFAGGVFPDYIYTDEDKQVVLEQLETTYALYPIDFTLTQPAQGDFSTIEIGFNDNNPIDLAGGILFGRAENIDFGNDVRNDNAFADASFWQLLAELDANFGTQNLQRTLGLEEPLDAEGIEAVRQQAVVNQSANTAAHELGHILGLRHHDSFGAPGDGLPTARFPGTEGPGGVPARDPLEFIPTLETDQNAAETFDHVMASGASTGLDIADPVLFDRFFSERSAAKLFLNNRRFELQEGFISKFFPFVGLRRSFIPNPLQTGENAGQRLLLQRRVINGAIDELGQEDDYLMFLREGQVFNAEIISTSDVTIEDDIFGKLTLTRVGWDGTEEVLAENQLTFEGREPLLFDFTVPRSGLYQLTVSAPDSVPVGRDAEGEPVFVNLSDFPLDPEDPEGPTFFDEFGLGDYNVYANIVDGQRSRGRSSRFAFRW